MKISINTDYPVYVFKNNSEENNIFGKYECEDVTNPYKFSKNATLKIEELSDEERSDSRFHDKRMIGKIFIDGKYVSRLWSYSVPDVYHAKTMSIHDDQKDLLIFFASPNSNTISMHLLRRMASRNFYKTALKKYVAMILDE